jgi:hypothetical protein
MQEFLLASPVSRVRFQASRWPRSGQFDRKRNFLVSFESYRELNSFVLGFVLVLVLDAVVLSSRTRTKTSTTTRTIGTPLILGHGDIVS